MKSCNSTWLGLLVVAAAAIPQVQAATEISLPGTGVSGGGAKLVPGATDPHWTVTTGPGIPLPTNAVVVANQHPLGFYFASPDSMWVWTNAAATAIVDSPYTFDLAFDLTGYDANSATLSGAWGVDNLGRIFLNGSPAVGAGTLALTTVSTDTFNTPYSFTIGSGFLPTINHLQFQVTDAGLVAALNVRGLSVQVSAVPEPAGASLMLIGLFGVLANLRRTRQFGK